MTLNDDRPARATSSHAEPEAAALGRLYALSDGVMAIAITLLVLDLRIPLLTQDDRGSLAAGLLQQLPFVIGYTASFAVIGLYWLNHHRIFRQIARFDGGLAVLNLVFLFFVALLPFPTSLLGRFGTAEPLAVALYAVNAACVGGSLTLVSVVATWRHLWIDSLSPRAQWRGILRGLASIAVFVMSIPLSAVDATLAQLSWLLIIPAVVIVNRLLTDPVTSPRTASR